MPRNTSNAFKVVTTLFKNTLYHVVIDGNFATSMPLLNTNPADRTNQQEFLWVQRITIQVWRCVGGQALSKRSNRQCVS